VKSFVQLSDTHIREPGQLAYRRVDTAGYLKRAVESIQSMDLQPDAVIITGDLTDFGRASEYAHLGSLLEPLSMPVYLMPGNHDDRAALIAEFPTHTYLQSTEPFIQYAVDFGDLVLLALDTCLPGYSEGALCADRLGWLDEQLRQTQGRPVVIAMHHPPFQTYIGHMDAIGLLSGREEFLDTIRRYDHIERIICGHLHRAIERRVANTIAATAPSPAHQVSLSLDPRASPSWRLEPPAFRVHAWQADAGLVTHTAYIGDYDGPFPFHENGELIDA
jgi:3',5'-cyclic-AMP phosphodiesterase